MAEPTIQGIFPNDESIGVPIGVDIKITFDVGIDLKSASDDIVIYGQDFDMTSGPDSAQWIDSDTGDNPFYLKSPGFTGTVRVGFALYYVDDDGAPIDPQPTYTTRDDEEDDGYKCQIVVSPVENLAAEVLHKVYVIGDAEEGTSRGVSARTIYDPDTSGVTSTTGTIQVYGTFTGTVEDLINIKITTAGDIGTAKYKWWYESEDESEARTGKVTSRRYRNLEDGVQIRFEGSGFIANDLYTVEVHPVEYLQESYTFSFTTGDGSIEEVPDSASTSVIGTLTPLDAEETEYLTVLSMEPADDAFMVSLSAARTIDITFSGDLDAATVTDDAVSVYSYPVSGNFSGPSNTNAGPRRELVKKLTVDDAVLTIEL
jgi:hypothetical protein